MTETCHDPAQNGGLVLGGKGRGWMEEEAEWPEMGGAQRLSGWGWAWQRVHRHPLARYTYGKKLEADWTHVNCVCVFPGRLR